MAAQPVFQEVPRTGSSSFWHSSTTGNFETGAEICRETQNDFEEARDHLFHVKVALLDRIECGENKNCTKIIVSSVGKSLMRHPPRYHFIGQFLVDFLSIFFRIFGQF